MESGRTQSAAALIAEDPGDEPDVEERNNLSNSNASNTGNNSNSNASNIGNNNLNSNPPLPPSYPCSEVCAHCGKKVTDTLSDDVQQEPTEILVDCPCECHKQFQVQPLKPTTQQAHIPPGGPNCLPGCGYSGLPCYNCTSLQNHLQPQEQTSQQYGELFPTQIYTVELMNPPTASDFQTQAQSSLDHRIIVQGEDSPEARSRRRTCISLVVFIITINVAIAIFRMLSGSSMYYG